MADSSSPNENDKPAASNDDKMPLPSLDMNMKSAISKSVKVTNFALGQLQDKTEQVSKPIVSRLSVLEKQMVHYAKVSLQAYQRRRQYGPELVLGTSVVAMGLVGLRRGRIPGAIAGMTAGSMSYFNIYGANV